MPFTQAQQQWINELVGSVLFQVGASADGNGNFPVFQAGASSADEAQPSAVVDEVVAQLRARGVSASNNGWTVKIMPPFRKPRE